MFKSIKINNLRAITELEINNFGQINVIVGHNSCGKTTLLEGLFFLIGATNPKLPVNANIFRELHYLSNRLWITYFHNLDSNIPVEIDGILSDTGERQSLVISPSMKESDASQAPATASLTHSYINGLELTYESSKEPGEKKVSTIVLKKDRLISAGTEDRPVRGIFVNPYTIADWANRFDAVQNQTHGIDKLVSLLNEIEPSLTDLRLNKDGVLFAKLGEGSMIPATLLGGGIVKFLSVGLAMLDSRDGIVLIDEVENGLDYNARRKLWEAILNWTHDLNVQVFATTHSWECIRAFNACAESTLFESEAKLFRIERKDDKFRTVEYTKEILAESLDSKWEVR